MSNQFVRTLIYFLGDFIAVLTFTVLAITITSELPLFAGTNLIILLGVPLTSLIGLMAMRLYKVSWRHTGLWEMVRICGGMAIGFGIFGLVSFANDPITFFGDGEAYLAYSFSTIAVAGFRVSRRLYNEVLLQPAYPHSAVIFGAGNAGDQIIRDISRHPNWKLAIDGIFDDDSALHGVELHGIKVKGGREELYNYLKKEKVSQIIIAAPSMPKNALKDLTTEVQKVNPEIEIKILPSFHGLSGDPVGIQSIREIRLEDILGREAVNINEDVIAQDIEDQTVLVTGAGGSIGSEMVRQVLKFNPRKVIAVEIDETELFSLENEVSELSDSIEFVVADVTNRNKMEHLFSHHNIDVVYHAAAYKHVPMMERHPDEAVRVNVLGTRNIAHLSCKYEVRSMVMISTDKVVNPTSVMGATKRIAEQICMEYNERSNTQLMSVRFGNVLGSRGSVVPIFMEQIKKGGPVTITDPDMKRYFMTIPEAVLLVMQAGTMGEGGEVFVLDMGEPVKIMDMARELIRIHGLQPDTDIPIEVNGLRPGEKLFEELLTDEEGIDSTSNDQIFKARCSREHHGLALTSTIEELADYSDMFNEKQIRKTLKKLVPTYAYPGAEEIEVEFAEDQESMVNGEALELASDVL